MTKVSTSFTQNKSNFHLVLLLISFKVGKTQLCHNDSITCIHFSKLSANLQVDGKNERRGGDDGEGLVVRGGLSVLPHGLQEGSVGDEEDDERDEDTVKQADEEVLVVEQRSQLAGPIEFGEFQAQFVINVLQRRRRRTRRVNKVCFFPH